MTDDPRVTASNGRVAAIELEGQVAAERYVAGTMRQVAGAGWAVLSDAPGGARQREVIFGDDLRVLEDTGGHAFVQCRKDGYVGYVDAALLGDPVAPTHWVSAPLTHLLAAPRVQAAEGLALPFGARLAITGRSGAFCQTQDGWFVPDAHLTRVGTPRFDDPATVAELFLGAPYLWGGNTVFGLDCSGLVQAALLACRFPCPGDSDQQMAVGAPGEPPYRRGDLLFWKGHVAMATDADRLIHANAHTMSVAYEPIAAAIQRIAAQGDGPVTGHRRLPTPGS